MANGTALRACWQPGEALQRHRMLRRNELVELKTEPALNATARFGLVTLTRRTETPALSMVRTLMQRLLRDSTTTANSLH